jgi:hypothetical protein
MPGLDANTKLLLHCNGTNGSSSFIDSSFAPHTLTAVGTAQLDTSSKKFGSASCFFDGNSDYITIPDSPDWDFGSGDFTVDTYIYISSIIGNTPIFYQETTQDNTFMSCHINPSSGLSFRLYSGASLQLNVSQGSNTISTGIWYHVAVVKNGTNYDIYLDGVSVATATTGTTPLNYTGNFEVAHINGGGGIFNNRFLHGNIDEFRVSNIARWTTNFIPPTEEYTFDPVSGIFTKNTQAIIIY